MRKWIRTAGHTLALLSTGLLATTTLLAWQVLRATPVAAADTDASPATVLLAAGGAFVAVCLLDLARAVRDRVPSWFTLAGVTAFLALIATGTLMARDPGALPPSGSVALLLAMAASLGLSFCCYLVAGLARTGGALPGIRVYYQRAVAARRIQPDPAQEVVVEALQALADDFLRYRRRRASLGLARRFAGAPKGIYLYGPVGRGKSFLMDGTYGGLATTRKHRYHLHQLLSSFYANLPIGGGGEAAIDSAARTLAPPGDIVFIDEFQIADLNTALLLGRLFAAWDRHGTVVCMTANLAPDDAFARLPDRARFRPIIDLLTSSMQVIAMGGDQDYRAIKLTADDIYQIPAGPDADARLGAIFDRLADGPVSSDPAVVGARQLPTRKHADGIAWFNFDDLCGGPFAYTDFIHLANGYHTLLMSDVPIFHADNIDAARRFGWLVELAYDNRKRLILSAADRPSALFSVLAAADHSGTDYAKVSSRLEEMQSTEYEYVLTSG